MLENTLLVNELNSERFLMASNKHPFLEKTIEAIAHLNTQEIEFVSYEDLNKQLISIADIFGISEKEDDLAGVTTQDDLLLKDIQTENELAPPGVDETVQRQGFTQPKAIPHKPFLLHYAAKNGDIKEIKRLVDSGWDVNQEDAYSSRPLFVATKYGHVEAVKYFIAKGADVHDDGYTGETALHEAIYKKHYDVARVLVETGRAIVTMPNLKEVSPLNIVMNNCFKIIKEPIQKIATPESIQEIHEIIETIRVFSKHCGSHCLDTHAGTDFATPVAARLRAFSSRAPTAEIRDKFLKLADEISLFDNSEKLFNNAKNLLNTFPTKGAYKLDLGNDASFLVQSKAHYGQSTTHWASQSVNAFYEQLKTQFPDALKLKVFSKLCDVFKSADALKANGGIEAYSIEAMEHYQQGDTILIGSGWYGHFIDVVLSKKQELFIVGNTGDRFDKIPAGLNFYHMNNPDIIKSKFIQDLTLNQDKTFFEQDIMYEYELLEQTKGIQKPEQAAPNCTWLGHEHGIEAVLNIELLNEGKDPKQAEKLANSYFQEWNQFHKLFQIETYVKEGPALPVNALTDIFIELVKKMPSEGSLKASHNAQVHKICDVLTSEHYLPEFKSWLTNETSKPDGQNIKSLFEHYGVNVEHIIEPNKTGYFDFFTKPIAKLFFGEPEPMKVKKPYLPEHAPDTQDSQNTSPSHSLDGEHAGPQMMVTVDPIPVHEQPQVLM